MLGCTCAQLLGQEPTNPGCADARIILTAAQSSATARQWELPSSQQCTGTSHQDLQPQPCSLECDISCSDGQGDTTLTDSASLPPSLDAGSGVPAQLLLQIPCSQGACPASMGKTEHGDDNHHEGTRYLCPPLQPQPLVSHTSGDKHRHLLPPHPFGGPEIT